MDNQLPTATLLAAIELIEKTPGYAHVANELANSARNGKLLFKIDLPDRAQAGLLGSILIGPEAAESSPLSLAQTLVHEHYHLHQNPFLKTVSFWSGVVQRVPVMRRYEQPAYQAAHDFLEAAKGAHPHLATEAAAEQAAIRQVFTHVYGTELAV